MNLQKQFEYNYEMNDLLIGHVLEYAEEHKSKTKQLISHILNAHTHWNNKILELQQKIHWDKYVIEKFKDQNMENYRSSIFILENYDLNDPVHYKNRIGNSYKNNITDILFHVINHSTYHRGQIAMLTRDVGLLPISTDYIFFKREN